MRIELMDYEVPPSGIMNGRVYFNMKAPATLESIGIDVNQTLAMTDTNGQVHFVCDSFHCTEHKIRPFFVCYFKTNSSSFPA